MNYAKKFRILNLSLAPPSDQLLLDYRNTPTQDADASPAQRNLGRRARTLLQMTSSLLMPSQIDTAFAKRLSWYYDNGAKDLNPLHEGDTVRIKPCILGQKTWKRETVNKRLDERSYEFETKSGVLRRNRVYLNRTNENREQNDSVIEREEITTENPRDAQIEQSSEREESATHPEQEEEATTRRSERTSRGNCQCVTKTSTCESETCACASDTSTCESDTSTCESDTSTRESNAFVNIMQL